MSVVFDRELCREVGVHAGVGIADDDGPPMQHGCAASRQVVASRLACHR